MSGISVVVLGSVDAIDVAALAQVTEVEVLSSRLAAADRPEDHRGTINPLVDEAAHPWVLLLRAGEQVGEALAAELTAASAGERAWGYRVPVRAWYGGSRLPLKDDAIGSIRLFHRRQARFVENPGGREMKVQGSVVRLTEPLDSIIYSGSDAHRAAIQGAPKSTSGQLATFAAELMRRPTALFRRAERTYLWIESGVRDQA